MKKSIFTINIDNYFPEMFNLCYPTIERYAKKINADFIVITERKFPDWHLCYEKSQVWELGKDYDWNIVIDADVLIHKDMPDLTQRIPMHMVGLRDTYPADSLFLCNDYFYRDGRKVGVSSTFAMASKMCHDLWYPLSGTQNDHVNSIKPWKDEIERGVKPDHFMTEYWLSINLARFGLKYTGILHENERFMFHHSYNKYTNESKLEDAINTLKKWGI